MKKIIIVISIILMLVNAVSYADDYTIDDAADTLVPYADEHIMTREECAIILSRILGVNDNVMMNEALCLYHDAVVYDDIEFNSLLGRCVTQFAWEFDNIHTLRNFYFDDTNFYGTNSASEADVLSWMVSALPQRENYKGKENLDECAIEAGLIDSKHEINEIKLTASTLKNFVKRFLSCKADYYIDFENQGYPVKSHESEENIKYINIFNQTYREKNIYIKKDGIYLGKDKINYEIKQPFIDENGIMMMPVEWFAKLYGFEEITFDNETHQMYLSNYKWEDNSADFKMIFRVNVPLYAFEGSFIYPCNIDTPAKMIDGSMYVPLRTVCESLMYNVFWQCE